MYEELFERIEELVLCHSPSGNEHAVDACLLRCWQSLGMDHFQDRAGNIIARIPAREPDPRVLAITAHKDEIGMIVKRIDEDGRVQVRKLGGSFPWVYGEGVVDLLGDRQTVSGILSFGSRHVSHESPQKAHESERPVQWEDAWILTKRERSYLEAAGIRPGTRAVIGAHRKRPFRLSGDYVASYALDNKASLAILMALAGRLQRPRHEIYLVASANEEVGAIGALHFTHRRNLDHLIALEICPKSLEYSVAKDEVPVLVSQDGYGVYDEKLNGELAEVAAQAGIPVQYTILSGFGSDGSIAMKHGHVPSAACLAFATENTHGYEIAHLGALSSCIEILARFCS